MRLKGNMVIELVDGNTGEEERIEEGNMVTNAVNDILGLNPISANLTKNYTKRIV